LRYRKSRRHVAPGVKGVAIVRDPTLPAGLAQFGAIQSVASSVEVSPVDVRNAAEIEVAIMHSHSGRRWRDCCVEPNGDGPSQA
jgi:hypothetical protein